MLLDLINQGILNLADADTVVAILVLELELENCLFDKK